MVPSPDITLWEIVNKFFEEFTKSKKNSKNNNIIGDTDSDDEIKEKEETKV